MPLETYRKKRDFRRTPEPSGKRGGSGEELSFVIHKHAARRLHYDLRLELDGVLKSWAVPKGPSLDPTEKRLAVEVEDHPIDYGGFEGVIPEGEYGAGTVLIWDRGAWTPEGDAKGALEAGKLAFTLEGAKLQGRWALVRMHLRAADDGKNWLLIKEKDDRVRPSGAGDILEERPESAASGRTMEEIAGRADRTWHSAEEAGVTGEAKLPDPSAIGGARKAKILSRLEPQLASLAKKAPAGAEWLHEIKFDGYRIVAYVQDGAIRLMSRRGNDWTSKFAPVAEAVGSLPVREAVFDGEVVALLPDGRSSFGALQEALSEGRAGDLVYYVFDLLHLDGYDLRGTPLAERKKALANVIASADVGPSLRYTDHISGSGETFHRQACSFALEGVVSKRADRVHRAGRGGDWLKIKCLERQEFVIGGYTDPAGSRIGFGALLLGVYDGRDLVYTGRVGTGFNEHTLQELTGALASLERKESPYKDPPNGSWTRSIHWVKPELVAEVAFANWTRDGLLRQPSFHGLREDKAPDEVVREEAEPAGRMGRPGPERVSSRWPEKGIEVAGVSLTNPDRVFYPEERITKLELASFYERIADWVMPHVTSRPLALVRCPEGYQGECFFQKQATDDFRRSILRIPIEVEGKLVENVAIDSLEGLVYLTQLGVLEVHTWSSRIDSVERPDRLVFDLDPDPSVTWDRVIDAARLLHRRLSSLGLQSFVKTTGGKGFHVVAPLVRRHGWEEVERFAKALADDVVRTEPDRYSANPAKAKRHGKIFIDYLRTHRGATAVAAYSTRARTGAPVSVPVRWDELGLTLRSDSYTLRNLAKRLSALDKDPWDDYNRVAQSITTAMKKELGLKAS